MINLGAGQMLFYRLSLFALSLGLTLLSLIALSDPQKPEFLLVDIASKPLFSVSLCMFLLSTFWCLWLFYRSKTIKPLDFAILVLAIIPCLIMIQSLDMKAQPIENTNDKYKIKIVFANLWVQNPHPEKLTDWINKKDPDIVAIIEATPYSIEKLTPRLKAIFPHSTRDGYMQVFSKFPIRKIHQKPARLAFLPLEISSQCGAIPLGLIHLTRPWPFTKNGDQMVQMNRLTDIIKERRWDENPRHILLGDFNHTLHTKELKKFRSNLTLGVHKGSEGTWPSFAPKPFRVRIDHIMSGQDWIPTKREVGPDYGSDHLPVYGEFVSADPDCANVGFSKAPGPQG